MRPAVLPRGDQRGIPDRTTTSRDGFEQTWSFLPDPTAPPQCSRKKRNGDPCQGRPIDGRDICIAHAKVDKNKTE